MFHHAIDMFPLMLDLVCCVLIVRLYVIYIHIITEVEIRRTWLTFTGLTLINTCDVVLEAFTGLCDGHCEAKRN